MPQELNPFATVVRRTEGGAAGGALLPSIVGAAEKEGGTKGVAAAGKERGEKGAAASVFARAGWRQALDEALDEARAKEGEAEGEEEGEEEDEEEAQEDDRMARRRTRREAEVGGEEEQSAALERRR